jgi:hypothetical protein
MFGRATGVCEEENDDLEPQNARDPSLSLPSVLPFTPLYANVRIHLALREYACLRGRLRESGGSWKPGDTRTVLVAETSHTASRELFLESHSSALPD